MVLQPAVFGYGTAYDKMTEGILSNPETYHELFTGTYIDDWTFMYEVYNGWDLVYDEPVYGDFDFRFSVMCIYPPDCQPVATWQSYESFYGYLIAPVEKFIEAAQAIGYAGTNMDYWHLKSYMHGWGILLFGAYGYRMDNISGDVGGTFRHTEWSLTNIRDFSIQLGLRWLSFPYNLINLLPEACATNLVAKQLGAMLELPEDGDLPPGPWPSFFESSTEFAELLPYVPSAYIDKFNAAYEALQVWEVYNSGGKESYLRATYHEEVTKMLGYQNHFKNILDGVESLDYNMDLGTGTNTDLFTLSRKAGLVGGLFSVDETQEYFDQPGIFDLHFEDHNGLEYTETEVWPMTDFSDIDLKYDLVTFGKSRVRIHGNDPSNPLTYTDFVDMDRFTDILSVNAHTAYQNGHAQLSFQLQTADRDVWLNYEKMLDSDYSTAYTSVPYELIAGENGYGNLFQSGNPVRNAGENPLDGNNARLYWPYVLPITDVLPSPVTVNISAPSGVQLEIRDASYFDGSGYPNEFTEIEPGSYSVYLNQNGFYSLRITHKYVTTTDIWLFDHWSASPMGDASFTNANNPTTGVNFHQEGVTVTANYVSANQEGKNVYVDFDDTLCIPSGGVYEINAMGGTSKFNIWGSGNIIMEGTRTKPIIFKLADPQFGGSWGGFCVFDEGSLVLRNVHIRHARPFGITGCGIIMADWYSSLIMEDCKISEPVFSNNNTITVKIEEAAGAFISGTLIEGDWSSSSVGIWCQISDPASIITIHNNTIVNFETGIEAYSYVTGSGDLVLDIRNNIIAYNKTPYAQGCGFYLVADSENRVNVGYNGVHGYTEYLLHCVSPYSASHHWITNNPEFIDGTNGDYHLAAGSNYIDAGDPDLDDDGITWENDPDDQDPDGTRMDMGALYYDGIPSIPSGFGITGSAGQHPTLYWSLDLNWKSDIVWYKIYRRLTDYQSTYVYLTSVDKYTNFYEDTQVTIASSGGKWWLDPSACYRITAEDSEGSESDMTFPKCKPYLLYKQIVKSENLPDKFALYENHPNPFNPITTIKYDLPEESFVELRIFDLLGREIRTLISRSEQAGYKSIIWNGENDMSNTVSSGIYIYTLIAKSMESEQEFHQTRKMVLLR